MWFNGFKWCQISKWTLKMTGNQWRGLNRGDMVLWVCPHCADLYLCYISRNIDFKFIWQLYTGGVVVGRTGTKKSQLSSLTDWAVCSQTLFTHKHTHLISKPSKGAALVQEMQSYFHLTWRFPDQVFYTLCSKWRIKNNNKNMEGDAEKIHR